MLLTSVTPSGVPDREATEMNTLSGGRRAKLWALLTVLGMIAALALVVVPAVSADPGTPSGDGEQPDEISGNPDCTLLDAGDYLFEHKTGTPKSGLIQLSFNGLSGSVDVNVHGSSSGQVFDFTFSGDFTAAAVIVKGGDSANFYDYHPGNNAADTGLHAPLNPNNNKFYGLSHISFCVDQGNIEFVCDVPQTLFGDGLITEVTAEIFANSLHDCNTKQATYTLEDDIVTLRFEGDGSQIAVGRLDFTKDFGTPPPLPDLQYDRDDSGPAGFVDVQWCSFRAKADGDGSQFDAELGSTTLYPSLDGVTDTDSQPATSCKVFESESVTGIQHTVVYFELEDPQWR